MVVSRALKYNWGIVHALQGFAIIATCYARFVPAVRLAGTVAATWKRISATAIITWQAALERRLVPSWHKLGEETAAVAWAEGQAMTLEQAVAYALSDDVTGQGETTPGSSTIAKALDGMSP
jgi:hypothetical protein